MVYQIAEKFKSIQGEGVYAGTPMAFIRFVGCSVGKKICQHCDTDFDKSYNWRGGGSFTEEDLLAWTGDYDHICLTGGEPLDQELDPLFDLASPHRTFHIETSGTKVLPHFRRYEKPWVCVSPKPGFLEEVVMLADEVKVIVPGLGEMNATIVAQRMVQGTTLNVLDLSPSQILEGEKSLRWPTIEDALRWSDAGKTVFLQPRNAKYDVDKVNLRLVQDIIAEHPQLRLSMQLHKLLNVQ